MVRPTRSHICFICSSGGHLTQALTLLDELPQEQYEFTLVTYETEFTASLAESREYNVVLFPQETSELASDPVALTTHLLRTSRATVSLLREHSFDAIVSTGAEIAIPTLLLAPLLGSEFIYIESLSRIDDLSWTGQVSRFFADEQLGQWEELADRYDRVAFEGRIV